MGAILLIAQASVAPAAAPQSLPDIELNARVTAREVKIHQEGPIWLDLRVSPGATDVAVARSQPAGAKEYRNLTIDARVAACFDEGAEGPADARTENSTGEQPQ